MMRSKIQVGNVILAFKGIGSWANNDTGSAAACLLWGLIRERYRSTGTPGYLALLERLTRCWRLPRPVWLGLDIRILLGD